MKSKIHLYGKLKKEFGPLFEFEIATAGEAFRALNCAFPGKFVAAMREGQYQVIRGKGRNGTPLDLDLLTSLKLGAADVHIIPVAAGASAKGGGTIKAIAGIAILGAAVFFSGGTLAAPLSQLGGMHSGIAGSMGVTWGNIALIGLGLTLAGAASVLAKPTNPGNTSNDSSFLFNGPVNTNEQGNPIPLVIGEVICGSQAISASYDIEDYGAYTQPLPLLDVLNQAILKAFQSGVVS